MLDFRTVEVHDWANSLIVVAAVVFVVGSGASAFVVVAATVAIDPVGVASGTEMVTRATAYASGTETVMQPTALAPRMDHWY